MAMEGGFGPGTVLLGKYRVESLLGRGGMGVVLRATHLHLGEEVALKILLPESPSPDAHARFLQEAKSAVRLRGEHVARVSDVGMLPEGAPYIVMEYLRGVDLSGELGRRRMLPPGEVVDYVLQACEALAEAHALGIVHRDIKPNNLFLTRRPDGAPLIKVLDFGISKAPIGGPGQLTKTDTVMGTPGYMSPEQMKAARDVDARTDIWALGIVLYECLNGRRPFDAESFSAIVLRAATEPAPPMDPRIPRGLQAVVLRCLEKDRAARFPSIAGLAAALAPFARDGRAAAIIVERATAMLRGPYGGVAEPPRFGQSPSATTLSGSAGMVRARSRRRYAVGGAVALLVALVVLIALSRPGSPGPGLNTSRVVRTNESDRDVPVDSGEPLVAAQSDAAASVVVTPASDAQAAPEESPRAKLDEKAQRARCVELEAKRDWRGLRDCAAGLLALGAKDKAEEFRNKAVKETNNAVTADKVQAAVRESNLREAQKQLRTITPDSVYLATTSELFRGAETKAIDDSRRKAQGLASAHDCQGLKRFQAELAVGSTAGIAAAAAVKCADKAAAAATPNPLDGWTPVSSGGDHAANPPPAPKKSNCDTMNIDDMMQQAANQYAAGFAKSALGLVVAVLACKQDVKMYRTAAMYACAAHDAAAAKTYLAKSPTALQSSVIQRCQQEGITCDMVNVEDTMQQAANQYAAGFVKSALSLVVAALACKQDVKIYRTAAMYACAAHDAAAAKTYLTKSPAAFQSSIIQRCQQEGINLP